MPDVRGYGGIEAGGTKFVCALGDGSGKLLASAEFPTRDPASTLADVTAFFGREADKGRPCAAIGIGTFGPVEVDPRSPRYGELLNTPKAGWSGFNIASAVRDSSGLPVRIDTDVNAAALAEHHLGCARDLDTVLYVTVGTGIGVGAVQRGRIYRGASHPEMGHMYVPRSDAEQAGFTGVCPYHGHCVEGLASGPAVVARFNEKLSALADDHPAWTIETDYLSTFLANLTFAFQPDRIVVGGGVSNARLLARVRVQLRARLAGYRPSLEATQALEDYVMLPALGARAGVHGAILLAADRQGGA